MEQHSGDSTAEAGGLSSAGISQTQAASTSSAPESGEHRHESSGLSLSIAGEAPEGTPVAGMPPGLFHLPQPKEQRGLVPQTYTSHEREALAAQKDSALIKSVPTQASDDLPTLRLHKQRGHRWTSSLRPGHWNLLKFDKTFLFISLIISLLAVFFLTYAILFVSLTSLDRSQTLLSHEIRSHKRENKAYMDAEVSPNCTFCVNRKGVRNQTECPGSFYHNKSRSDCSNATVSLALGPDKAYARTPMYGRWSPCSASCGSKGLTHRQEHHPVAGCRPLIRSYPCNRFACPEPPPLRLLSKACSGHLAWPSLPASTWHLPEKGSSSGSLVDYSRWRWPAVVPCCSLPGLDRKLLAEALRAFLLEPKHLILDGKGGGVLFQPLTGGGHCAADVGLELSLDWLSAPLSAHGLLLQPGLRQATLTVDKALGSRLQSLSRAALTKVNVSSTLTCHLDCPPCLPTASPCLATFSCGPGAVSAAAAPTTPQPPSRCF